MGAVSYAVRPLMPVDLQITTTPDELDVTLNWVNPTQNSDGSTLTAISGVKVFRNGTQIANLTGMTPGAAVEFDDTAPTPDDYTYMICAYTTVDGLYNTTLETWLGPPIWATPTGPDEYGYIALETGDPGGPDFEWIEIDPSQGGPGTVIPFTQDDETWSVDLDFAFPFYGYMYGHVSICSNGWVAMDYTTDTDYSNSVIPDADGPPAMVAPFWEDLSPQQSGSVSYYNDNVNHLFIVEYYQVRQYLPATAFETFQVIFYDPDYYPTTTGDGMIKFQYLEISDPTEATFGIENNAEAVGIELGYNYSYPETFQGIVNNHAVLFVPPDEAWPVTATLTPESSSIHIPASGGSFDFDIDLTAPTTTQTFDVWTQIWYESTWSYYDMLSRTITQAAGMPISRGLTQNVPANAPSGQYGYIICIGDEELGIVWSWDNFIFWKDAGDGGSGGSWACVDRVADDDAGATIAEVKDYMLLTNTPNPFNPETTLRFALPEASRVCLEVYNMRGQKVATLVDGWRAEGTHEAVFNGANLASGLYIYRLQAGDFAASGKMMLLK